MKIVKAKERAFIHEGARLNTLYKILDDSMVKIENLELADQYEGHEIAEDKINWDEWFEGEESGEPGITFYVRSDYA